MTHDDLLLLRQQDAALLATIRKHRETVGTMTDEIARLLEDVCHQLGMTAAQTAHVVGPYAIVVQE